MLTGNRVFSVATLFSAISFLVGCAPTARLRGSIDSMEEKIKQVERNGAYTCAPKELALARSHLRFALLEIEQGRSSRAKEHFEIAKRNTRLANEKSPVEKCAGVEVIVAAPLPPKPKPKPLPPKCVDDDGDRICAKVDKCPDKAEDMDGVEDTDGCPEDQDSDLDGIMDTLDQCPVDSEDMDGFQDEDGCPEKDNDMDGIDDVKDRCINEPEDPDGFEDEDGCPDPDNDEDKVLDLEDECPNEKGVVSEAGCPKKYEGVEITETHIRINQKIHFAYNRAKIKKTSHWILNQVADVLKDYPDIFLSIEGHTDSKGSDKYNKKLSTKRAKAVMKYLSKKRKISSDRLKFKGWGEEKPIDTNATNDGRAANRRVEFVRTEKDN